jgi:hypothetical protein
LLGKGVHRRLQRAVATFGLDAGKGEFGVEVADGPIDVVFGGVGGGAEGGKAGGRRCQTGLGLRAIWKLGGERAVFQ